jgi:hypothetical protein
MSVAIGVWKLNDLSYISPTEYPNTELVDLDNVIGYVIAAVVKQADGGITLEREVAVHADNAEDNGLAESVVKTIERKLNEAFPDPNQPEPSKLWVPA